MFYLIPRNQKRKKHESMIDPNLGWQGGGGVGRGQFYPPPLGFHLITEKQ